MGQNWHGFSIAKSDFPESLSSKIVRDLSRMGSVFCSNKFFSVVLKLTDEREQIASEPLIDVEQFADV